MYKAKYLSALLFGTALLSGCTVIPGSHFSNSYGTVVDQYHDQNDDLSELIDIYPITAASVQAQTNNTEQLPANDQALRQQIADYDYKVGPGDVLSVIVWDHPELTTPAGEYRSSEEAGNWVHADGTIFYPYIGNVKVAGLKISEIRDLISRRLARYVESPQVDVTIAAFRSKWVYVTGEVERPGTQPITNIPLTLVDAVSKAGGITEHADWQTVVLNRGAQTYRFSLRDLYKDGDVSQNILLQPNDVININRNDDSKVFVLGEVGKQQTLPMGRNGKTLAEALADAEGMSQVTADATGVFVMRKAPEQSGRIADVYQLNAKNMAAMVLADSFKLQERDIVYVTAAPVARWNRVIGQLLPTLSGVYTGTRLVE
ncbi:polysaccharide export protein [Oceanisphaera pacifica]|uniref:Polysaccharide biosynthesis/export family protein n=1 Tax=Oceanisphaera pacifica TaxID=2818389 RepID=A0ABS3NDZ9_9GAMM|nr:polysaccharide export protein [Oceanisphaera pacifica]MBO1518819.1 polysaccharide biosynthesis/export family protein [Oceanisphaera pacifica]